MFATIKKNRGQTNLHVPLFWISVPAVPKVKNHDFGIENFQVEEPKLIYDECQTGPLYDTLVGDFTTRNASCCSSNSWFSSLNPVAPRTSTSLAHKRAWCELHHNCTRTF